MLEVACDESGAEGEHLAGATTDVFAHAGVVVTEEHATAALREIRGLIRSPAQEYKANHLLREKHGAVLRWFLGPEGPIHGTARVHLVEKEFFLVERVLAFLLGEGRQAVIDLYGGVPHPLVRGPWQELLAAANELMRTRNEADVADPVSVFYGAVRALREGLPAGPARDVLGRLERSRDRADLLRPVLVGSPSSIPVLDPLFPAIEQTVASWSGESGGAVSVVHDDQRSLTGERVRELRDRLEGRLGGWRLVDSRQDARVQLADFLAGVARKIASEELNGRGDGELTAALAPYVDPGSVWGDARSWARLGPVLEVSPRR